MSGVLKSWISKALRSGLFLILVAAATSSASAQKNMLTAEIAPESHSVRSGAPISVVWKLNWQRSGLLRGRLQLIVSDGDSLLGKISTQEMVLRSGEQLVETTLPIFEAPGRFSELTIRTVFLSKNQKIGLGAHSLLVPTPLQRRFVTCVCDPFTGSSAPHQRLVDSLRFEQFNPDDNVRTVSTIPSRVHPGDMPADPLGYCGFNIVLLTDAGFSSLREKQLAALLAWVDAGGSLCVLPRDSLEPYHVKFLNDLAGAKEPAAPFLLDSSGRLVSSSDSLDRLVAKLESGDRAGGIRMHGKGLGRVAIVLSDAAALQNVNSPAWRRGLAFLWRMRAEQTSSFVRGGQWDQKLAQSASQKAMAQNEYQYRHLASNQLTLMPIQSGDGLLTSLIPENVRGIPLSLIMAILFLYVLAIGPGDYFLLGFLKLRHLTWVSFPVITISFTLAAVWLSHAYLATHDTRRAAELLDVGDSGTIVRKNRFELLFTGTARLMPTELRRELFTPLNHQRFGSAFRYMYQGSPSGRSGLVGPAYYEGRIPQRYKVTQLIPQWTPQLNRRFSILPDIQPVPIDWGSGEVLKTSLGQNELKRQIVEHFGSEVSIRLFHGSDVIPLMESRTLRIPSLDSRSHRPAGSLNAFLQQVCVRPGLGLFGVVSQIAPGGADNFEDLSVLDPSDEDQWLVVITVERDRDILIYRKLYRE